MKKVLSFLVVAVVGFGLAQDDYEPTLYQPYGDATVGDYTLYDGYEPGVNDADYETNGGALLIRTVSPDEQGIDVVLIGPNGYKNVMEIADEQLVEELEPGTYVLAATDDGLDPVSTKVDVSYGRTGTVTLTLNEMSTTAYDPEVYTPYGGYEEVGYEPIDTAEQGNLVITFPAAEGFEDTEIVGEIVGPDDYRQDIDGASESLAYEGLEAGQYIVAFTRETGDVVEGLADVRGGEAASFTINFSPYGQSGDMMSENSEMTADAGMMDYSSYDTDADGLLSEEEFNRGVFMSYDANQDGMLDEAEYDEGVNNLYGGEYELVYADFDANTDAAVDENEFMGAYDNAGLFGTYDADGDGFISEEEYDANEGLF